MSDQVIIVGGVNDPSIEHLIVVGRTMQVSILPLLIRTNSSPAFHWDMRQSTFQLDGEDIHTSAAFIRRDVFHAPSQERHDRSLAWYTALTGWVSTQPDVRILNRNSMMQFTNKLQILEWSKQSGLTVPETYVTNHLADIDQGSRDLVAKPVMGGGYCHYLDSIIEDTEFRSESTANPAIVQQQIKGDDIRIYRVGESYFGFAINSDKIDYRQSTRFNIEVIKKIPSAIILHLSYLMDQMKLNWEAADFKRCDQSGQWYFLEVNSNPMFSVFDRILSGKISESIFNYLLKNSN